MPDTTLMRCVQGGACTDRHGRERIATYGEIYRADDPLVQAARHLFCPVGSEDRTPDPVAVALSSTPVGSNSIDGNASLERPAHPGGVWWRR